MISTIIAIQTNIYQAPHSSDNQPNIAIISGIHSSINNIAQTIARNISIKIKIKLINKSKSFTYISSYTFLYTRGFLFFLSAFDGIYYLYI